jgi:phage-related holin
MFKGYKTYFTAGIAVLTAAAGYLTGEMELAQAIQLGFSAILASTVRAGITSEAKK